MVQKGGWLRAQHAQFLEKRPHDAEVPVPFFNVAAEGGLGDSIADPPVAQAAPEWMSEKAVSIGFYVAASAVYTVLGVPFPIQGARKLTDYVCNGMGEDFGEKSAFEPDPVKASRLIIDRMDEKRRALGLVAVKWTPYTGRKAPENRPGCP